MSKRKDYINQNIQNILNALETATSIKEVEEKVGLSTFKIRKALEANGYDFEEVKQKLKERRNHNRVVNRKISKEPAPAVRKDFLIDASIVGLAEFEETLNDLKNQGKIILTSVTIRELDKLQKSLDFVSRNARIILKQAAEDDKNFECCLIDENFEEVDDNIIEYCRQNKKEVILVTSDKVMTLKARMYGIETKYFQQNHNQDETRKYKHELEEPKEEEEISSDYWKPEELPNYDMSYDRVSTLYPIKYNRKGERIFYCSKNNKKVSKIFSHGREFRNDCKVLEIGDDIFIATKKQDDAYKNYVSFVHYQIRNLEEVDNCNVIYFKKIYDFDDFQLIEREVYRKFVSKFVEEVGL